MEHGASGIVAQTSVANRRQILWALIASSVGVGLDMFDMFLLLYVAPTIGELFFPKSVPTLALAGVYAAYATSLVMRPLGSALFGSLADKRGRKKALMLAMTGVGVVTAAMGLLPTVNQIGYFAVALFVILRILQGTFVGGVTASTHTIGTETVPPSWRGWVSGLVTGCGGGVGGLLSALVFWAMSHLFPGPAFATWGWRCMFFSGILSSIFAFIIFRNLNESPFFVEMQKSKPKHRKTPISTLFSSEYRGVMSLNVMIVTGAAAMFYLTSGYLPTFLGVINKIPKPVVGDILIWAGVVTILVPILSGHLSEMFGRRKAILFSAVVNIVVFYFAFDALAGAKDFTTIAFWALLITCFGNAAYGPLLIFLNERFPTSIRATGTALCWSIGFALGGLVPTLVSIFSPQVQDIPSRLWMFMVGAAVIFFIGGLITPETKGKFE
jgi:MFS family permease